MNNSQQIGNIKSFNTLMGGLATNTSSLLMGGNATFNILNLTDFGSRINVGLLELTVGKDGISSKIGNGGTNISYSNIKSSIRGASSLHKNSQINNTKYDKQTKDALRSQWGFGDKTAKKQLEEIIKGDTILKLDAKGSEVAQSINENGQKIIHLNSSQNDGFIDLGLTLQHEAHRDGIVSDEQGQYIETVNAVAGHTQMALAMAIDKLYTKDMLNHISSDTNLQNDINAYMHAAYTGNTSLFAGYVGASYDSSADYWKLKMYADGTHELIYDGEKELSIDYLNENGEVISTSVPENQDMSDVGMAGSLGKILGIERVDELLGSSYLNADNYDFNTLKDVLKLSDNQIAKIQRTGSLDGIELTESQKYSLVGEAIIKNSGASWNGSSWINTEGISLTITDKAYNGNIMAEVQNGKYLYSTVNATLFRDPDSWNSVTSSDGINWEKNTEYYGLDSILYEKQGINYDYYDYLLVDKYQTVDNLTGLSLDGTRDYAQPYYNFATGNWIQGNTIVSSVFNMGYYHNENAKVDDWRFSSAVAMTNVLQINNATTLSNINTGNNGGGNI